jgi:hypothetical protein
MIIAPSVSASVTRSMQDTPTRLQIAEQEIVDF